MSLPSPIPLHPVGVPHLIAVWYEIHAVCADPTGWALKTVLNLVPDTWSPLTLAYDQMDKMGKSMTSPPSSITDSYLWPNWRKYLLAVLRWIYMKHSQRAKWRRRVGQRDVCVCGDSIPLWAQHPNNHIHHLESSLNPNIYELLRFQETGLLIEELVFGHWSESQCPSFFPKAQKLQTFILLIERWVFNLECLVFL